MIYLAIIDYFATGEGRHVWVAAGASPEQATTLLKERTDEYYHVGIEVEPADTSKYVDFVSPQLLNRLKRLDEIKYPFPMNPTLEANLAESTDLFVSYEYNYS